MKLVLWIFFLVSVILTENVTKGDITEYFLRDPYSQLDLFQHSNLLDKKEDLSEGISKSSEEENNEKSNQLEELLKQEESRRVSISDSIDTDALEDYYDYLYDIGALPEKTSTTTTTTTTPRPKQKRLSPKRSKRPHLSPRKGHLQVGADVLARVKKPIKNNRYSNTHNNRHRDNVAVESFKRSDRIKRPMQRKEDKQLPGLENVERLIPGSLKTVIEDSGKRIVKAVMQPINDFNPRDTQIRETSFTSAMGNMFGRYRTYFGYMAPTFAPDHITTYLVAQWTSTFAITIAWISVGYMFQTMGIGRSDEGRSNPEPWEELVPDSGTVATVLHDLSEAAQRWHDEL